MVKTRSGFDSNQLENPQRPRCKEALKFVAEVLRDLTLLFWYTLPGPATNLRFYCLILARMVFYVLEATAFYAMTATIMAGADTDDPGVLVELTRLLLCSAAEQVEARVQHRISRDPEESARHDHSPFIEQLCQRHLRLHPGVRQRHLHLHPRVCQRHQHPGADQRHRLL